MRQSANLSVKSVTRRTVISSDGGSDRRPANGSVELVIGGTGIHRGCRFPKCRRAGRSLKLIPDRAGIDWIACDGIGAIARASVDGIA